ncbi:MAG: L-2-amino-thiazoline-4-carboxylic acid hydrolase [Isosphaeraceae bacterium]
MSQTPSQSKGSNTAPVDVQIPLLRQREIEARIVGPIVAALIGEIGDERALALLRRVITSLARAGGADLARSLGDASLTGFAQCLDRWTEGGALEIELLEQSDQRLAFNVTRCRYAEMYRALGLDSLGSSLSCLRDYALIEGFNPAIALTRTQTLMEGASHCDFRFERQPGATEPTGSD